MSIVISIFSIAAITLAVWLARKYFDLRVCPICAGVSLTWLWMFGGLYFEALSGNSWSLILPILMGGSVVGSAYQLEKKFQGKGFNLFWKSAFIIFGFTAVYQLLAKNFFGFAVFLLSSGFICLYFWLAGEKNSLDAAQKAKELEEKMKNCC